MAAYVALLRGINVAGHKPVAMASLRELLADLGLEEPRSLLQSGNLVFQDDGRTTGALEELLEQEAVKRLGLRTQFMVRSAREWRAIVAANPFPAEAERDPGRLHVMCLKKAPGARELSALQAAVVGPERVAAVGKQAYLFYPHGMGRSRLTTNLVERRLATSGTARNWNTVLKLAALLRT